MAGRSGGTPSAPGSAGWNTFDKRPGAAAGSNRDGGAPSLIRCAICKKPKSRDEFSKRQLLKFTAYNKGSRTIKKDVGSVHATCSQCTANQTVELKCCVCDKVKGLDLFAKNQRKDPDNARCIKCVDRDIDAEPDLHPDDDGDFNLESSDDDNEEEEPVWDGNATANNIKPYRPQDKPTAAWSSAAGEDDEDEFEDVSSSATSTHGGSSRQQGYQLPARPGAAQRAPAVSSSRANQPSNTYAGRAPPVEDDDDEWETMDKNRSIGGSSRASSTASPSGYSSQQPARRKNGWGKVSKAASMPEEDPWAKYNRK